jgi:phospholipid/cholesterol/gamma-HCH transport system permease protein
VIAAMFTFPMLVIFSAFLGILGGYLAGTLTGVITERDYLYGIRDSFVPYNIFFMCVNHLYLDF